ncbi:alpha/beta fold hydrolase [Amycolatopsis acididurans]|uniref:alpha/beta fold hydrolase n=1 Tax=Amycolatopsis acididurans TaxID=2724524 RepID=UPI0028AAFD99|nr:alpha/beta fold hydrolase [Amycolatopsis acididurans]
MTEPVRAERLRITGYQGLSLAADRWEPEGEREGTAVFLHGGGQTRHSWARTARGLAAQGWRAITVDARGHGDSSWSRDGVYSLDSFAADLYSIVDSLDERPVVIGASLGGRAALVAEGERPGVLAGLVLVDIAARVDPDGQARVRRFMGSAPDGFASLEEAAEAVDAYRPGRKSANPDGLQKNLRRRANGRWYWHWDPNFLAFSADPRNFAVDRLNSAARNVAAPTLVVRGTKSDMVSSEAATELIGLVPSARLVEVAAGHMIAGDDNDMFTAHLGDFLAGVTAPEPLP